MPRIKLNEPKERAPLVLACGSPIKILISGKSKKLAIAQTFRFVILREAFLPAAQKGISGADLNIHSPIALMRSRASQSCSDKHDGCLSAATNLYGTNLDVLGARKVSGLDATNQFTVMPEQIEKRR